MPADVTLPIITGPTASGKSAYALEMAAACNGVIINADAMQLYNALPILTAQPSTEEQAQIPHRLYGALDPWEDCSAQAWRDMALAEIHAALEAGQTPIVVGGTGFYIKALIEGFSPIPDVPEEVRAAANEKQAELGNPGFYEALVTRDPMVEGKLDPLNTQRLVRAWEVFEHTGTSLIEWQSMPKSGPPQGLSFDIKAILRSREELAKRIETRFDQMMAAGVMGEVKALSDLMDSGKVSETALIVKAHGFRNLRKYLKGGLQEPEVRELTIVETRQYAKRQETWIRHQFKDVEIITV